MMNITDCPSFEKETFKKIVVLDVSKNIRISQ